MARRAIKRGISPPPIAVPPAPETPVSERTPVSGRVLAVHGRQSLVEVDGDLYRCHLSGRLKHRREDTQAPPARDHWRRDTSEGRGRWGRSREHAPPSSPIAVGDSVTVLVDPDGSGVVLERHDRKSWLGRIRPTKGPQVIAANVEIALVVVSVADPEPNFFLLDQFLVQAAAGGLEPWIVFNKIDLLADRDDVDVDREGVDFAGAREYRAIGYPVFCTSALTLTGIDALQEALRNRTAALAGPSGVGKSNLLNDLAPRADARLGEISEWSGRGQHTTTHVAMYPLPCGGYLVDAPGIRRLTLWKVPGGELPDYFPEFSTLASQCDFSRCSHMDEIDCAVRAAAESGAISWRRYKHYREMRQSC